MALIYFFLGGRQGIDGFSGGGGVQGGLPLQILVITPQNKMFTPPKICLTPLIFGIVKKNPLVRELCIDDSKKKNRRTLKLKRQSNVLKLIAPCFHSLFCLTAIIKF